MGDGLLSHRSTGYTPAAFQDLAIPGDLPLLPAYVGKAHEAVAVDDEEAGTLAQGDGLTLHLVKVVDLVGGIHQAGKGYPVPLEIVSRRFLGIVDNGQDLDTGGDELTILLRQPAEMPAAEGSLKAPEEHQDDTRRPAIIPQREQPSGSASGGQGEVGGR